VKQSEPGVLFLESTAFLSQLDLSRFPQQLASESAPSPQPIEAVGFSELEYCGHEQQQKSRRDNIKLTGFFGASVVIEPEMTETERWIFSGANPFPKVPDTKSLLEPFFGEFNFPPQNGGEGGKNSLKKKRFLDKVHTKCDNIREDLKVLSNIRYHIRDHRLKKVANLSSYNEAALQTCCCNLTGNR